MPYPTIPEGTPVHGIGQGGAGMPPYPGVSAAYPDPNANSTPYPLAPPAGLAQGKSNHQGIFHLIPKVSIFSPLSPGPGANTGGGAMAPGGWNF